MFGLKIISGFALSVVMVAVLLQVEAVLAQCSSPPAAPNIKVELPSQARVRAGEPLEIRWKSEGHRDKGCRYPLYLVFTTRAHARFEGEWFTAFPVSGAGPFGISQAIDQTRVFIPLHALADKASGAFKVKFYTAGENTIDWFVAGLPGYFSGQFQRPGRKFGKTTACGAFCAFDLPAERFCFIELTEEKGGERLDRTPVAKGDILIADRGFMHPDPLAHILEQGAAFAAR